MKKQKKNMKKKKRDVKHPNTSKACCHILMGKLKNKNKIPTKKNHKQNNSHKTGSPVNYISLILVQC